jgi:hypothetical protein
MDIAQVSAVIWRVSLYLVEEFAEKKLSTGQAIEEQTKSDSSGATTECDRAITGIGAVFVEEKEILKPRFSSSRAPTPEIACVSPSSHVVKAAMGARAAPPRARKSDDVGLEDPDNSTKLTT